MKSESEKLASKFEVEDIGPLEEYVGCKIEIKEIEGKRTLKFTQPVLVQSLVDEFELPNKKPATPAVAGLVLTKGDVDLALSTDMQTKYRSGVVKLLHIMRW